jgi:hypothetical protein
LAAVMKTKGPAEPRWPAGLALLAAAGLHFAMPSYLTPGPDWAPLAIIAVVVAFSLGAHALGNDRLSKFGGFFGNSLITVTLITAVALLVSGLPSKRVEPKQLLVAAMAIWFSNILVFASWYWRLDAGGPGQREAREFHTKGAFLFPQMAIAQDVRDELGWKYWRPGFVDYLFVAFNTSTAFSPTDVPVLSPWAKAIMMVQSMISLSTLAILAARAINIL